MTISEKMMDQKIDEHFGFEARDDIEGVLATLTEDAKHDIVGWPGGPTYGRENARPFYTQMFADLSDSKVTCQRRLYGDNFLVDESVWEGKAPGNPFGIPGKNRNLKFRLLHIIEFNEEGNIKGENVWFDMNAIFAQLA